MFRTISLMVVCLCVAAGNIANGAEKLGAEDYLINTSIYRGDLRQPTVR